MGKSIFILLSCFLFLFSTQAKAENALDFQDTLLIINYNHPYYDSIPFLKEMYSRVFPHIVFYGEKPCPGVIAIPHNFGWWAQNIMYDAMIRWPDFKGYLLVQDDCWMNFWNFARLDKDKVWFSPGVNPVALETPASFWWYWWGKDCGKNASTIALKKVPQKYLDRLNANIGPDKVGTVFSDFIYIPGRLREAYLEVSPCFGSPPVFLEIAIPTIMLCIEDMNEWEILNINWGNNFPQSYAAHYDWVHPVKFSNLGYRKIIKRIVGKWSKENLKGK